MKKAIYYFGILLTIFFALLGIAGFISGYVSPIECDFISFFGLALLPSLAINLLLVFIWLIRKSLWTWLPTATLFLNISFILSMLQFKIPHNLPQGKESIKMISYNIDNFSHDGNDHFNEITQWLINEKPDILCLQECPAQNSPSMDSITSALPFLPYSCYTYSDSGSSGNALFSKYPIVRFESMLYSESDNKSLSAVLDLSGQFVRVVNNHFQTTSVNAVKPHLYQAHAEGNQSGELRAIFNLFMQMKKNFVKRARQADFIRQLLDAEKGATIVCGDFNDTPCSYTYKTVKGDLTDGFRDCGSGFGYTFRQLKKLFRIDYIFYSSSFKGLTYDSPNLDYSDHKPVVWKGYVK